MILSLLAPAALAAGDFFSKENTILPCRLTRTVAWYDLDANLSTRSLECAYARLGSLTFMKTALPIAGTTLPIFLEKSSDSGKAILIWLHGGPHQEASVSPSPEDLSLISTGAIIIKPQYTGSLSRGPFSQGGFKKSVNEIEGLVDYFRRSRPGITISTGGPSYGGYLATVIATRRALSCAYIVDPMIEDYYTSSLRSLHQDPRVPRQAYHTIRKMVLNNARYYFGDLATESLLTLFAKTKINGRFIIFMHNNDLRIDPSSKIHLLEKIIHHKRRFRVFTVAEGQHGVLPLDIKHQSLVNRELSDCR